MLTILSQGNTKVAPFGDIHALSEEDWDYTWNMLVKSNVFLFQAALPHLKANADGGVYLMQSSIAGLMQNGSSMAYSVCRAAQLHLNRCLAETQGPEIRVNAVCPGLVETERGAAAFNEQQRQGFREMAKLKRITVPEEIASAMVFAAQNTGMTGERIRVDSGMVIT